MCSLQRRHRRDGVVPTTTVGGGLVRQLVTRDDVDAAVDITAIINNKNDIDEGDKSGATKDNDTGSTMTAMATMTSTKIIPKSPRALLHTAMVVSGIRSDADYLSDRLRSHAVKHWFRYNTSPSSNTMAEMVRDVMLDFLGFDRGEEVRSAQISGGIGSAAPSYNGGGGDDDENGNDARAGRPLGVSVFLLGGLDSVRHGDGGAEITSIEADGSSRTYVARAMGVGSQYANEKLSHHWRKNMSVDEAKDMMRSIMKDVAREVGWFPSAEDEVDCRGGYEEGQWTMVCEIVTSNGVDVDLLTM